MGHTTLTTPILRVMICHPYAGTWHSLPMQ